MKYRIEGYQNRDAQTGYDGERTADTLKEARREARYMLSDEYRMASEATYKLAKIMIWKGHELIDEIYGEIS